MVDWLFFFANEATCVCNVFFCSDGGRRQRRGRLLGERKLQASGWLVGYRYCQKYQYDQYYQYCRYHLYFQYRQLLSVLVVIIFSWVGWNLSQERFKRWIQNSRKGRSCCTRGTGLIFFFWKWLLLFLYFYFSFTFLLLSLSFYFYFYIGRDGWHVLFCPLLQ